jgi:hypothetical protein
MSAVRANSTAAALVTLALCAGCGAGENGARRDADAAHRGGGSTPASDVARTAASAVARTPAGIDPQVAIEHGLIPTPIGRGPEFRPAARAPASGCGRGTLSGRYRAHVELFGRKQAVVIPAGIGVGADARQEYGRLVGADCRAEARTLDPTGVVHFDREDLRLGDLFAIWGRPLRADRAYVNGKQVEGQLDRIPLRKHDQIVLEVGGYVRPHSRYGFPPGL